MNNLSREQIKQLYRGNPDCLGVIFYDDVNHVPLLADNIEVELAKYEATKRARELNRLKELTNPWHNWTKSGEPPIDPDFYKD